MSERTVATQWARLFLAGMVTVFVMGATLWQLASSSRDAVTRPVTSALNTR